MPQETKTAPPRETDARTLQGLVASRADEDALLDALEKAFDYRGDVTITTTADAEITGYLFDRRRGGSLADSIVRLMTPTAPKPVVITFSEVAAIAFTGKDAAHGKTFENWVKRYIEKKLAGEDASIYSDADPASAQV